ncbi:MAG: AAA family ATPase [Gammaproteobacteria bacterium]
MTDKLTSENFLSSDTKNDEMDLGKIFRFLLMQSKLIIAIVTTVFIISYAFYHLSPKKYLIQSLLQYEAFDQNVFDPSKSLQMASSGASADIFNLTTLYESRTNYLKVIRGLKLNLKIEGLYDNENIDIEIISDNNDSFSDYKKLKFSFSESGYALLDDNLNEIQKSKYGEQVNFNELTISIKSSKLKEYRPINISYINPERMYESLKSSMNINTNLSRNSFFRNEGLITVSYVSDDVDRGKEIINYANNIFLNQRITTETEKSRKAINFIDKNISTIKDSVESNKVKLKKFRERNKSIDVSLEIQAIINKIQSLDESLSTIDIELAKAEEIYTSNNPTYLNLLNEKTLIEKQKESVLSEIEMMPKEQQEYIDLYNELEVSQALFEELESRRLGFSILEASTIGDIRVIDEAYVVSLVSPKLLTVLVSTMFAFLIACIFAIIRGINFLPISNPAEIFDNNIHLPILGVIPHIDDFELDEDNIRLNSSIESLIVNLNSIQNEQLEKNLLTITSPSPGNGKSTISMKLAEGFAKIGKKVLLVDNDLKRGNIAHNYNLKSISGETFNSIDQSSINKYKVQDNLYVIPRVKGLNNTFQFLYNYQYKEKIKFFKDNFDFVIFDTGPILSVADSSILIEQSDFNILVARHGINRMNEIKQSIENFKQINTSVDGIVYNAYAKPVNYYGYYGIYGNYSYQYYAEKYLDDAYEYEKKG